MSQRTTTRRKVTAALAGLLATGSMAGAAAMATGLAATTLAGADTPGYTLTCELGTTPLPIPGAVTTGSLPATVAAGSSFTLANYGIHITLPASGVFVGAAGATVSGTYTTDLAATGATPANQATTFDIPTQTFPSPLPPGGQPLSATGTAGAFTAQSSAGTATIATTATSVLTLTVNGAPLTLDCTEPPTQIAATTVTPPQTTVTGVLPNAGPLAGGTSVTIAGTFLSGATAVDFGTTPGTITADSATSVTATAPPGSPGTVDVTVTTPIGTSAATPADQFTYTAGPIVNGVSPNQGAPSGGTSVVISGQQLSGATAVDFGSTPATSFTVGSDSSIIAVSPPGTGTVDVTVIGPQGTSITSSEDHFTYQSAGYWTVASDGGIFSYGGAPFEGSMGGQPLNKPIVGMAPTPDGRGYWEVASDGGIFAFGDASFYGSTGALTLDKPIVAMAAAPDGAGYWLVASDGGIFAFGDASFYGSTGGRSIPSPIVTLVAAPDGTGYWEVAASGTVYAFGNPGVYGSAGGQKLNAPIVGAATTSTYNGDWQSASDGGIFAFGSAGYFGSLGGTTLNQPVVGFAPSNDGQGYWLVASDGGIFAFGDATFSGSMGGQRLNAPMVGMAAA